MKMFKLNALRTLVALAGLSSLVWVGCDGGSESSALRLENLRGYTMSGDSLLRFEAMVVDSGRVIAVGSLQQLRDEYPSVRVRDLKGQTVLPGFIDAHGHVMGLGRRARRLDLVGCSSISELQTRLRAFARAQDAQRAPDDSSAPGWILGRGWNQELWPERHFPTAADLDSAVGDRPVWLERIDGHAAVGNSLALKLASIYPATQPPAGGAIQRTALGWPNGVFVDAAMDLVERHIPPPTPAQDSAALASALREIARLGLTTVHDAGISLADWQLYSRFGRAGQLTCRLWAMAGQGQTGYDSLLSLGPVIGQYHDRLALRAVKIYADGALGSRGAALLEPYADQATQGLLFHSTPALQALVQPPAQRGYQVCVHAIGDAANRQVIDVFAQLIKADTAQRHRRHRIEHAQVLHPTDLVRLAPLGLVASMQPTHATSDKNMAGSRLGAQRLSGAYAWRSVLRSGALLAAGSDFPVESANPLLGWHAAVTRQDTLGLPPGGWLPTQALTLVQALKAFTIDAARAGHQEALIGSLEPGKYADYVILSADPFATPPDQLWRLRVIETWLAGERVYPAP